MKRNGYAIQPGPRSFEELKPTRVGAAAEAESSSSAVHQSPTSSHASASSPTSGVEHEKEVTADPTTTSASPSPRQETTRRSAGALHTAEDPDGTAAAQPSHRYPQQSLHYPPPPPPQQPMRRGSMSDSGTFAPSREVSVSSLEAPASLGENARLALGSRLVGSESDDIHPSASSLYRGAPAPSAAAAAAGARAAGAAVPFLFPIKLPTPSVTHLGGRRISVGATAVPISAAANALLQSSDSLGNSMGSPLDGSPVHSRRHTLSVGEGHGFDTGSPGRQDEVLVDDEAGTHGRRRGSAAGAGAGGNRADDGNTPTTTTAATATGASGAAASAFSRDVGPLPASEARARNRLPSGTHIRRRPRSGARRGGASDAEPCSPAFGALDATVSSSNALGATHLRSRGLNASIGAAAGRGGTGRTKNEVLPPGTRGGVSKGVGANATSVAQGPRRRADPSPAPSRPQRARKTRTTASAAAPHSLVAPTFSPSSPAQVPLRGSNPPPQSLQLQRRMLSEQSSPGITSPLNCSLERNHFSLSTEKDGTAVAAAAAAPAAAATASTGAANNRSSHRPPAGAAVALNTKPPSGRRQGSLARVLVPAQAGGPAAGNLDDSALALPRLDPAKVAATYLKLCAEVGDEPNLDWVAALSPVKASERAAPTDALTASLLLSEGVDTQELSRASLVRVGANTESSGQATQQQQQQPHTPRGGVRPRILTGPHASPSVSTTTFPNGATGTATGPQRASTPAARRTKSPGARHSVVAASSPLAPPKRSGSVGRITAVNRPSIFGSSTQQPQQQLQSHGHASTGVGAAGPSWSVWWGAESSPTDEFAKVVMRYCAEHLQPLADSMHSLQEQRTALADALEAFVHTARTTLASSAPTQEPQGPRASTSTGSGRGGNSISTTNATGAIASTTTSSPSTTPRKASAVRQSTASAAGPPYGVRRPSSAATAAAAKAACLSDSLQTVQAAVVTLLNTLSDGAALASAVTGDLASPLQREETSAGASGGVAAPPLPGIGAAAPSAMTSCSIYSPGGDGGSGRLGTSPGAGLLLQRTTLPAVPQLHLTSAVAAAGSSTTESAAAGVAPTHVAPTRYIDYMLSQEREVAVQLGEVCAAVREALGSPVTPLEAAVSEPADRNHSAGSGGAAAAGAGAGAAAAAGSSAIVRVEVSDMLSTPLFVPPRYLNSLTIAVAARRDVADEDLTATTRSSGGGDHSSGNANAAAPTTPHTNHSAKSSGPHSPKSTAHATTKKGKSSSSKVSSSGGGTTGRSSTTSTPRARASGPAVGAAAVAYAPFFTFTLLTPAPEEEAGSDGAGESGGGDAGAVRSASAASGDGAAPTADAAGPVESYLLHCVQPGTAAGSLGLGTESEHTSGRQASAAANWTTTDLSASVGHALGGSGTSGATSSTATATGGAAKRTTGKTGKRSASAGAGKSGRAGGGGNGSNAVGGVPTLFGSRPALSASLKAPSGSATTTTSGGTGKTRKKAAAAAASSHDKSEQAHTLQQQQLQVRQQRQLVRAWALWRVLMPYAGSHGVGPADTPSFSPRPSSASASMSAGAAAAAAAATVGTPTAATTSAAGRTAPTEPSETRATTDGGSELFTPPATSAPTAAASPAAAAAAPPPACQFDLRDGTEDDAADLNGERHAGSAAAAGTGLVKDSLHPAASAVAASGGTKEDAVSSVVLDSLQNSPPPLGPLLRSVSDDGPGEPLHFDARSDGDGDGAHRGHDDVDNDDDAATPSGNVSATRARVAESMASLSSLPAVPRRLNMDEAAALLSHRGSVGDGTPAAAAAAGTAAAKSAPLGSLVNVSAQSSSATMAFSASMQLPHATVISSSSGADDAPMPLSRAASALAPTRAGSMAPASELQRRAAQHIAAWWVSTRERRAAQAVAHGSHVAANAAQRRRVLLARRDAFLRLWVCRWRLRQRIQARVRRLHEQQQQQRAAGEDAAMGAENAARARRSLTQKDESTGSPTAATAATSRDRFLRAKEQRKAALASVPASGTARVPSPSSSAAGATTASAAAAIPVPPLPLATSGISTFVFRDLQEESSNFTVSAMHRLLNAPPALLYTTCMVALRYPTNAPMAYLDSTALTTTATAAADSRQQSEAPPAGAADTRGAMGGGDGTASLPRCGAVWTTSRGTSLANAVREFSDDDSDDDGGAHARRQRRHFATAQERRWGTRGVLFIRFLNLRHYVCGEYEALIPVTSSSGSTGGSGVGDDAQLSSFGGRYGAATASPFEGTLTSATRSFRGSLRAPLSTTALLVPATLRYDSIVDPNELQHAKPVVKPFHRPFEQWGMAHNLASRVFCAAAIYAWQLIFSHTPFDDAKQRELATREEQQARLERVEDRNGIILDCYGVHSEREWMREATKDLSFVGQIYLPNYDQDDPEQQKESRDNYDFVKNFLFQCFPNIHKLTEIPDYLVGAGLLFVLKEVFHYTKDSPSTRRVLEVLPRLVVAEGADHLTAVTPAASALASLAAPGTDSAAESPRVPPITLGATATTAAAPRSLSPLYRHGQYDEDGDAAAAAAAAAGAGPGAGLSGLQRAALQRYEQLRLLHHLSHGFMDTGRDPSAKAAAAAADKASRVKSQQQAQQAKRTRSPAASTASTGGAKERGKAGGNSGCDESSDLANSLSTRATGTAVGGAGDDANSPLRRCMASAPAGPVTPMRATPLTASLGTSLFTSPAVLRDAQGEKEKTGPAQRRGLASSGTGGAAAAAAAAVASAGGIAAPPSDQCVQLVRVPHRLLRSSAASAPFVRDFEEEVSRSVHAILRAWNGNDSAASLDVFEMRAAVAAQPTVRDCLDIAYPRHFLVKLSEALAFELFGLQLSLSNCEDLDSTWQ